MPVTRIIWSAHAQRRRSQRLIDQVAVENTILANHSNRMINRGEADWRLDGLLADGRRFAVVYDHPAHSDPGVALVVSLWDM